MAFMCEGALGGGEGGGRGGVGWFVVGKDAFVVAGCDEAIRDGRGCAREWRARGGSILARDVVDGSHARRPRDGTLRHLFQ